MTMEGLINTFCKTFYPITDAASVLQYRITHLSLGKRISHMIVDVTDIGKPHS